MKLNTMAYYGIHMEENHILNDSGLYSLTQMNEESSFLFLCCQNTGEIPPSQQHGKGLRILENADCVLSSPLYLCL